MEKLVELNALNHMNSKFSNILKHGDMSSFSIKVKSTGRDATQLSAIEHREQAHVFIYIHIDVLFSGKYCVTILCEDYETIRQHKHCDKLCISFRMIVDAYSDDNPEEHSSSWEIPVRSEFYSKKFEDDMLELISDVNDVVIRQSIMDVYEPDKIPKCKWQALPRCRDDMVKGQSVKVDISDERNFGKGYNSPEYTAQYIRQEFQSQNMENAMLKMVGTIEDVLNWQMVTDVVNKFDARQVNEDMKSHRRDRELQARISSHLRNLAGQ